MLSNQELIEIIERASTIKERLGISFVPSEFSQDNILVDSRLENWCRIVAQGDWNQFEKRLAWDELNLDKVRYALGCARLRDSQEIPVWASTLNECLKAIRDNSSQADFKRNNRFLDPKEPLLFEDILLPFINVAREKLSAKSPFYYQLLSEESQAIFERKLLVLLSHLSSSSFGFEFLIFQATKQSTATRLLRKSSTKHSRKYYQDFIKSLLGGGLLIFFQRYAVLARLMSTAIDFWIDSTEEFLCRLASDWGDIQKTFQPQLELGQVTALDFNLSDSHNNGRTVLAVSFSSGLRLIYKPRNLGIEIAFNQLLAWFNSEGFPLPFRLFKVLNRSSYGWVEFVESSPCKDEDEIKRYFKRGGAILCLAYVLEGTDFHSENLIACGEHPVLIDLETLMHPLARNNEEEPENSDYIPTQYSLHSVLDTLLLPRLSPNLESPSYYNFRGGLEGVEQQEQPFQVKTWQNINTDDMTLDYSNNTNELNTDLDELDLLDTKNLVLNNYQQELIEGFQEMYRFLIKKREELLEQSSPLTILAHQEIRFVFRPTRIYGLILTTTLDPSLMRDGADRSIQLDILSRGLLSSEIKPLSWPLLDAEKQSLEQLDIPHFTAHTDEDFLKVSPFNNQILEKYFAQPSYNLVLERLKSLNHFDLEKQTFLIRDSLNTFSDTNVRSFSLKEDLNIAPDLPPLSQQDALQHATTLARYLKKESIVSVHQSKITWLTRQYIPEAKKYALISLDNSLYYGSCGITLFLAALENVTGDAEFRDLIMAALRPLHLHLKESASKETARRLGIGGGVGLGSTLYGLVQTSKLSGEAGLLEDAQKIALLITPALITSDQNFDIISGAAGAILALLALYNDVNDSEVLEQAIICGHHLLNNRCVSETGHRSWVTFEGKLLTGFSHGAAGIAFALLRLYQASGEVAFLEAAHEAIAYERSVFISEDKNWPDFREVSFNKHPICQCSWCHGAPGIGLARVAGLDILDTKEIRQDIEAAINTTKCHQLMDVDHLCCGNLGRVEFLFTAARKLCEPQLRDIAMIQAAQIVKRAEQIDTFGYPLSLGCNPGFFLGAAGIGYQLLRLAYPDQLPSVLLWE